MRNTLIIKVIYSIKKRNDVFKLTWCYQIIEGFKAALPFLH